MASGERVENRTTSPKAARGAGLQGGDLTLSDVDRRRTELWTTSIFVVAAIAIAVALITLGRDLLPEALRDFDMDAWIVVVLVSGLALAFLIYVLEKERNLRKLTALLIEERVLSAALSNRLSEISRLSELGKAVNTTLDLQDVFHLIISSALELLGGTEGSIMLLDDNGENFVVMSYEGPRYEAVMGGTTPVGSPIAGIVAQTRKPMLLQGDRLEEVVGPNVHKRPEVFSAVCVPLIRNEELLGVLNLSETEGRREFTEQDLSALGFFAEHAAIAIGNARLFEQERATIAQLEELDRLKSDFVATISHELKTPLTAIIGAAKTVSRKGPDMEPAQHADFMDMIDRQGNRLLRLIEDVLVASRIESGTRVMRREHLDLRELAEGVVEQVVHSRPERKRDIVLRADPDSPRTWGDMTALIQIMTNLVDNALKYSDSGSKVIVFVQETATEAVIEVADHGRGIEPEQIEMIFERFRQLDASATRKAGGVGLGLFIVKNLVDAHGGTIAVDSEPGAGTTFTVRLPKRRMDRPEEE